MSFRLKNRKDEKKGKKGKSSLKQRLKNITAWPLKRKIIAGIAAGVICAGAYPAYAAIQDYIYSADPSTSVKWVQKDESTWTYDINSDGKTDITLTTSKDAKGNDVWKYVFNVEDNSQAYYAFESMLNNGSKSSNPWLNGYTSSGSDGKSAVEAEPGTVDEATHSYTITNHKDHTEKAEEEYGKISVTKNVTGTMPNENTKFVFRVVLSGSTDALKAKIKGTQTFGDTPFVDGQAMISVGKGETKTIEDIPAGLTYKVTENSIDNYEQTSAANDSGTVEKDTTDAVTFTNASTYTPKSGTGKFTIIKKVTGASAEEDASYTFHVALRELAPEGTYSYKKDSESYSFTAGTDGTANVKLMLKKDESAAFTVPEDATYQIIEEGGGYTSSYKVTGDKVAKASGESTKENADLTTGTETAEKNEDAKVTFTNAYKSVQNLTLVKYMQEKGQPVKKEKKFEFQIDFSNLDPSASISSPVGMIRAEDDGTASKTFYMTADGSPITFSDVPYGVQYKVTELKSASTPSYVITTEDTRGKTISGTVATPSAEGESGKALSTAMETVEEGQSDTVTFYNGPGFNFGIEKVDADNRKTKVQNAVYELFAVTDSSSTSLGSRTTNSDGFAGWDGVNSGTYVLKENSSPSGYHKSPDMIIVVDDDQNVKYATSDNAISDAKNLTSSQISAMKTWVKDGGTDGIYRLNGNEYSTYRIYENITYVLPTGVKTAPAIWAAAAAIVIILFIVMYRRFRVIRRNDQSESSGKEE